MELTRRAVLQGGVSGGLAFAFNSIVAPPMARGAATNRVRVTTGTAYGAARTSVKATFPSPIAGNLLLAVVSVDGSAGNFRVPTGWRMAFQRIGTSLSLAALYRLGTGSEVSVTLPWSTSSAGGSWFVAEYTGVNASDPLGPLRAPAYSDVVRTSMALNPPAAEAPSIQLAVFGIDDMDLATTGAEFRPTAAGWGWVTTSYRATQSRCPATALTEYGAPLSTAQSLPSTQFSWLRPDQVIGAVLQLNTSPSPPVLVSRWVGAVTSTGATVAVKLSNVSTAHLKLSRDPGLSSGVIYSASATPDVNGIAKIVADGLVPGTQYHYAVEMDGTVATSKVGSFRTRPTEAASFTFAFGSCCNSPGAGIFSEIRNHDPDLFIHLGDLHYGDIAVNDPAAFRAKYDTALASAHQGPLYANVPTVYTWSDHDFGPNGSDSTSASRAAAQDTYRQYVPSYPLVSPTGGIYQTFSYGRVLFVVTDNRSYKSPRSAVDDANKTMLGAEQKQWFRDVVSSATEPVIIWVNENPWIGSPSATSDWWGAYGTERAELARFLKYTGKRVAIVSGDMHALAADDGSNSPGGIPVFQAAAFSASSSHKGGPYSVGPFPSTTGTAVQQYGVMRVQDMGAEIALQFTGYRAGRVAELSYTHTFAV